MRSFLLIVAVAFAGGCGCEDETGDALRDAGAIDTGDERDMPRAGGDMPTAEDATTNDATTPADVAMPDVSDEQDMPVVEDMAQSGPLCFFPGGELYFAPAVVGVPASTSAFSFGTVSVWNCSDADVVVTDVAMSSDTAPEIVIDFVPFNGDSTTLEPNETMLVELRFAPEAEGEFSGALEITHDGQVDSVPVRGVGISDPDHCRLALGPTLIDPNDLSRSAMRAQSVEVNGSYNDNFVLANVGRTECNVQSITLDSPGGAFSFPFPNQTQTPTTLSFRQLRVINIGFDPTTAGPHTATITMTSDDGTTPTHVLEIRGDTR